MGKRITLYLTDAELNMIQKICESDGKSPNMSRTLKDGLLEIFNKCVMLPENARVHMGLKSPTILSSGEAQRLGEEVFHISPDGENEKKAKDTLEAQRKKAREEADKFINLRDD